MPEDKNVGRVFKDSFPGEPSRFVVILGRWGETWYWVLTHNPKYDSPPTIYKYRRTWVDRRLAQELESAGAKSISLHPITGIPL